MDKLILTDTALAILQKRYLRKDEFGNVIETPSDMWRRISRTMASVEANYEASETDIKDWEDKFYEIMSDGLFLPNSPTIMNSGKKNGVLSACYVLPIDDSMESIFDTIKHTALIHKSGGGTGFSFSSLRPNQDMVSSTKGVSSGPISFMKVFNEATEAVKQGGSRRGANIAILNISHPDILDFITCKKEEGKLNNFNISVAITDEFMNTLAENGMWNLINPRSNEVVKSVPAKEIWDAIVEGGWSNGEPGIIFIDTVNKHNPTPELGKIVATNPCGEQPLMPYESCNLGSINLAKFVVDGDFDWISLDRTIRTAMRFLDNVIDANHYPLPQIEQMTMGNRKVGLGVMGWADALILLNIPYNSDKALLMASEVMNFINRTAVNASRELAMQKGVFPNWEKSIFYESGDKRRNASVTTIAPTGTISTIADCSSGIEPYFSLAYDRHIMDNKFTVVNKYFTDALEKFGIYEDWMIDKVEECGSIQNIEEIPDSIKRIFLTTFDISPEYHVLTQAVFQKYTESAVSKTVNFKNDATREDIREVYEMAYREECRGITVYRDNSRKEQVLNLSKAAPIKGTNGFRSRPRADVLTGITPRVRTSCGNLYVTMNSDEHGLSEVFAQLGKSGDCVKAFLEWGGRIISTAIRAGVSPTEIAEKSIGIMCPKPCWHDGTQILSCPDAIGKQLIEHFNLDVKQSFPDEICPECGSAMHKDSGCSTCTCGYSKCS